MTEVVVGQLADSVRAEVIQLIDRVTAEDGVAPVSEHALLHLRDSHEHQAQSLLERNSAGVLVGFAHLDVSDLVDGPSAELAIHPNFRGQGHEMHLGHSLVSAAKASSPHLPLRLWAHGESSDVHALATALGMQRSRELLLLRRSLESAVAEPKWPAGTRVRTFLPGLDDDEWLSLNARAFLDHPEQGAWTARDLSLRIGEPWFDPAGFFIAVGTDGAMLGFHWTKVHGAKPDHKHDDSHDHTPDHEHEPIGEIYVLGVDPRASGVGLGKALTLVGLNYLRGLGLHQAMLYVDADNLSAVNLYQRVGFEIWDRDVMYQSAAGSRNSGPMA